MSAVSRCHSMPLFHSLRLTLNKSLPILIALLDLRLRLTSDGANQAVGITKDLPNSTGGQVEMVFYPHAHGGNSVASVGSGK